MKNQRKEPLNTQAGQTFSWWSANGQIGIYSDSNWIHSRTLSPEYQLDPDRYFSILLPKACRVSQSSKGSKSLRSWTSTYVDFSQYQRRQGPSISASGGDSKRTLSLPFSHLLPSVFRSFQLSSLQPLSKKGQTTLPPLSLGSGPSSALQTLLSQASLGIQRGLSLFKLPPSPWSMQKVGSSRSVRTLFTSNVAIHFPAKYFKVYTPNHRKVHLLPKTWARPYLIFMRNVYINY